MNRRAFLASLASLAVAGPLVRAAIPCEPETESPREFTDKERELAEFLRFHYDRARQERIAMNQRWLAERNRYYGWNRYHPIADDQAILNDLYIPKLSQLIPMDPAELKSLLPSI